MSGERKIDRPFCDNIGQTEAEAEVERLLADPLFQSPERNRNFLRFIATEYFEGRAEAIKAYAIAVDVFGRPSGFDPSTDPIVRIEATRLRAALSQYYDRHGSDTGIRVDLPRGRYVPVFTRMNANERGEAVAAHLDDDPDPPAGTASRSEHSPRSRSGRLAVICALVVCGFAGYVVAAGLNFWRQGTFTHKPLVSVVMTAEKEMRAGEAEKIRAHLMVAMSQFQTVRLASSPDPAVTAAMTEWPGLTLASVLRGQRPAKDYQVALKYEIDGRYRFVWWQVKDDTTGEVLQSGVERALQDDEEALSPHWDLANDLARTIAGTRGIINTVETMRDLDAPSLGNGCVLRAVAAIAQGDEKSIMDARSCLERTLTVAPNDASAKAELAIVLLTMDSVDAPTELSARAHKLASDAATLAPFSDRSKYALMMSQFRVGQIRAAIETGYAAMALNPNNNDISARLGLYLMTVGHWEEGAGLATKAMKLDGAGTSDILLARALNAYRLGRFEDALTFVQQMGRGEDYLANAVQAAAAGQLGRAQDAQAALGSLGSSRTDFDAVYRKSMAARHVAPMMIDLLETGMLMAAAQKS